VVIRSGQFEISLLVIDSRNRVHQRLVSLQLPDTPEAMLAGGRRYALLIGNEDYRDPHYPKLHTPRADVSSLAQVLQEQFGFKTEILDSSGNRSSLILKDVGVRNMSKALDLLARKLLPEDTLIIFYADHGTMDRASGTGFWVGADAEFGVSADLLAADTLSRALMNIAARNVLVIADSCYAGALTRDIPDESALHDRALLKTLQKKKRIVITSGAERPVLDGGGSGHSIFARALLQGLQSRGRIFSATGLFQFVHEQVAGRADQEPQKSFIPRSGHEEGDFVFVRREP
jgi:uncharacterized caspase-like protein